jgi:hypothetical protein
MLQRHAAFAVLFTLVSVFPVMAQPAGNVVQINVQVPKPGMADKYEAARKKHNGWHKAQKDTWTWNTWEVISGEESGTFITGTFGHAWKDFDGHEKFQHDDSIDFGKGIGPTLAHVHTSYYVRRADLSLSPPSGNPPPPFIFVTFFLLKPEGLNDFIETVKKVNEGIKKTNYPQSGPSAFFQLVNGGEGPLFVLVGDRANWAAFAPNEKTLDAMMEEAYGKEQGAAILASGRKAMRSTRTETLAYRADLSYVAPK